MNRDDIIRMAREAGGTDNAFSDAMLFDLGELERFAALVSAAEREACAKLCEQIDCGESYHGNNIRLIGKQ